MQGIVELVVSVTAPHRAYVYVCIVYFPGHQNEFVVLQVLSSYNLQVFTFLLVKSLVQIDLLLQS